MQILVISVSVVLHNMSTSQLKNCKTKKQDKKNPNKLNSQEKKQSGELDSKMLEQSGREFKITMINVLKACGKSEQYVNRWRILTETEDHTQMLEMKTTTEIEECLWAHL